MTTIHEALRLSQQKLLQTENPPLEASLLLSAVLQVPRATLYAYPERTLTPDQQQQLNQFLERRAYGEPLAYLLQQKEFWSLTLQVTPDTLIPRPETEGLVEIALQRLDASKPQRVADLGTGSGAIALALASERPLWHITATDHSATALVVAQQNAQRLSLSNINFRLGDWCEALENTFRYDAIVSNPPYIKINDEHLLGEIRFEPNAALVSGADGLDAIREIIQQAPDYLRPEGWLLLEHGAEQGAAVRTLLQAAGFKDIFTARDLGQKERCSGGIFSRQT
ncbi:MAG: peptide chain release factor N(5)-glutamine methyltransferase [Gammaproteobacteria bacterium]